MDEVTQRNAAMAAETNAACIGLSDQVQALETVVSGFKTTDVHPNTISRAA
ncbi:hypothetical protein [Neorhizobium galegae]|uniref:hypothetical protein n=1 Tax=Neorhizobium galegae TaxID=399 RepID=UPI000B1BB338|nr:hypothetical protein [Neorhizobium galegae]MCQ1854534.1 hypothetical protein [Neorhizobium galegae]